MATVSTQACPGCASARVGGPPCVWHPEADPHDAAPTSAHEQVDWTRLQARTRWHATPTTFGPVVKILLTLPLWLAAGALLTLHLSGTAHSLPVYGALAVAVVSLLWTRQVWRSGRIAGPAGSRIRG